MRYDTPLASTINNTHKYTQQTRANKQAMESLAPRIKALSASLCQPVLGSGGKEEMRRKQLKK